MTESNPHHSSKDKTESKRRSTEPLYHRLYFQPHLTDLVQLVGYDGIQTAEMQNRIEPLVEKYGIDRIEAGMRELFKVEGEGHNTSFQLREKVRKLAVQLLGHPPETLSHEQSTQAQEVAEQPADEHPESTTDELEADELETDEPETEDRELESCEEDPSDFISVVGEYMREVLWEDETLLEQFLVCVSHEESLEQLKEELHQQLSEWQQWVATPLSFLSNSTPAELLSQQKDERLVDLLEEARKRL